MAGTDAAGVLEAWVRQQPGGYIHPDVHIASEHGNGVHWRASASIEPGTRLITIPHSLALSYLNVLVDDEYPVFQRQRKAFDIEAIGFFYLMLQYVNRTKSFWKSYLDTLPRPDEEHTTPLWFDDPADEAWLADTDALYTMSQRKQIYEQQYQSGIATLRSSGVNVDNLTWDLFRWAVTMFTSRSFSSRAITPQDSKYWTTYKTGPNGRRQTALIDMSHTSAEDKDFSVLFPGMDASNHHHSARVDWTFDPGRFGLSCTDTLEANHQVNNNYGPKGNDELLVGYGFCVPNNPFDTVMLTLKPPPEALQQTLRHTHSGFFTSGGQWSGDKATFRLRRLDESLANGSSVFDQLPEPLLELLTQIVRFDRGLPFEQIPDISEYLKGSSSHGRRYLPFVARMIVTSLAPKYQTLQAGSARLPPTPQTNKQSIAKIYRDSQTEILGITIAGLKASLRMYRPPTTDFVESEIRRSNPSGAKLMTMEEAIAVFSESGDLVEHFLAGVQANANTSDLEQLRLAGWEEDVWVLLLCYAYIWSSRIPERTVLSTYMAALAVEYSPESPSAASAVSGEASGEAGDLLQIVRNASQACGETAWSDERWSEGFIAGFGGRVLKNESFMMMVRDGQGAGEEARLVVYLHA